MNGTWPTRVGLGMLALFLVSAHALAAQTPLPGQANQNQPDPLRLGPLVFGESSITDVEDFIGESLRCGDPTPMGPEDGFEMVGCLAADSNTRRYPEASFMNGRLVTLRYLPLYDGPVDRILDSIRRDTGLSPVMRQGEEDDVRGLRYWVFSDGEGEHLVMVSEVRLRDTGERRLRISFWMEEESWYSLPPRPGGA